MPPLEVQAKFDAVEDGSSVPSRVILSSIPGSRDCTLFIAGRRYNIDLKELDKAVTSLTLCSDR